MTASASYLYLPSSRRSPSTNSGNATDTINGKAELAVHRVVAAVRIDRRDFQEEQMAGQQRRHRLLAASARPSRSPIAGITQDYTDLQTSKSHDRQPCSCALGGTQFQSDIGGSAIDDARRCPAFHRFAGFCGV